VPLQKKNGPGQGALKKKRKKESEVGAMCHVPWHHFFFVIFENFGLILDFRIYVGGVFELLMQRNGQKRDRKKVFVFLNFFGKTFWTSTFPKKLLWCF
jgi:hypothetical protein